MFGWFWHLYSKLQSKNKIMQGIDCSHHQGVVDFTLVAGSTSPKVDFLFLKATEGRTYIDPTLKFNSFEAKKAGLRIGYYHFATLNTHNVIDDAMGEATFFVDTLKNFPLPDLPLILDIESNKANLNPVEVQLWIKTFFSQLENLGQGNYALYSYTPFLNANLPKNHSLGNVRLWIAAYVNKPEPTLPAGWEKYWIWQYSAKGRVPGVKGDVDMNKTTEPLFYK